MSEEIEQGSLEETEVRGGQQLSLQVSELAESGRVVIPTSLTFWSQPETARRAPNVVEIPADSRGTVIRSRISGSGRSSLLPRKQFT